MNAVNDLLSSAMNQHAPEIQLSSASLSGPEVFNQLMSKSSWKRLSCVCSDSDAYESDRELMGRTNFFSSEHSTTASSLWHCQRIIQERNSVYFGCWYRFGFRERDKAQILRWKASFCVLATSLAPLLTFPEDLFHMLNNVLLHRHNRDSQPKGLKD